MISTNTSLRASERWIITQAFFSTDSIKLRLYGWEIPPSHYGHSQLHPLGNSWSELAYCWTWVSSFVLHQLKQKPFLFIQTTFIKESEPSSPVIEAISPLGWTTNLDMRPQIDDTLQKILVTAAQSVKAGQIILVLKNVQQMIKLI